MTDNECTQFDYSVADICCVYRLEMLECNGNDGC